ncbi:MAG: glycosyltransferase [Gemmatimonadota bacterium]|nr:glycosyltransferase [Gemmatimonadota bacterium]
MSTARLSVVIGCVEAAGSIEACLASLRDACDGISSEIIVVDASRDDSAARAAGSSPESRVLRCPPGLLIPQLWARGYAASTGQVVAFTIGQCVVARGWARSLLDAIAGGATGAGGGFELADAATMTDCAVFFLRYSPFLPREERTIRVTRDIAGDNAAYRRDALERHAASFRDGFWEVDFHRRIRAEGAELVLVPEATVRFAGATPLGVMARHRFAHGRQYGASRVEAGERRRWQLVLGAPLVPALLWARVAGRLRAGDRWKFAYATPAMLLLAAAWAAGESWGAMMGGGRPAVLDGLRA